MKSRLMGLEMGETGVWGCLQGGTSPLHTHPTQGQPPLPTAWPVPSPEWASYLKPPVILSDGVGEVDPLPLGQELAQLRPLLHAQVIAHEIPVDAVPPPLFEVVEDVGGCVGTQRDADWTGLCTSGPGPSCPPKPTAGSMGTVAARSGARFMPQEESEPLELDWL